MIQPKFLKTITVDNAYALCFFGVALISLFFENEKILNLREVSMSNLIVLAEPELLLRIYYVTIQAFATVYKVL